MFKKSILFKMHTTCNTINKYNSLIDFYELRKMSNRNRRNFAPEEDLTWGISYPSMPIIYGYIDI